MRDEGFMLAPTEDLVVGFLEGGEEPLGRIVGVCGDGMGGL